MSDGESRMRLVNADGDAFNIDVKDRSYKDCEHERVTVDAELRTVTCVTCRKTLDPVQVLINFSNRRRVRNYEADAIHAHRVKAWARRERIAAMGKRSYKDLWEAAEEEAAEFRAMLIVAEQEFRDLGQAKMADMLKQRMAELPEKAKQARVSSTTAPTIPCTPD